MAGPPIVASGPAGDPTPQECGPFRGADSYAESRPSAGLLAVA